MIELLLGDLGPRTFLERHYGRLPLSCPGGARGLTPFPGWPAVESILAMENVDAFLAREGRMWEGGRRPSAAQARELLAQGHTLVIRSAERHDPELARLASGFQADFAAPVNVHVYCTPAPQSGFGWHYDPEDVFIVQTHGSKEYELRKNTVNPWPTLEQMPRDLKYEREVTPRWRCALEPGDWLYVPAGWWHSARGLRGDSITLAIGLMTPTVLELVEFLRRELGRSVVWRQRLPVIGRAQSASPDEQVAIHQALLAELGRDLMRSLGEESLARRFVEERHRRAGGC